MSQLDSPGAPPPFEGEPAAAGHRAPSITRRLVGWARELGELLLFGLVAFVLVQVTVQNFEIDGPSMQPTLAPGQRVLVNKLAYVGIDTPVMPPFWPGGRLGGSPARGDIVVLRTPAGAERDLIKRVIGLPGETVELRAGRVFIDGEPLDEPYVDAPAAYQAPALTLPPDHFYVLGDNRNNSSDSHVWGPLPRQNLIGAALVVYWPPGSMTIVLGHDYDR